MLIAVRLESNPHTVRLQEEESISDAGTCLASDVGIIFLLVVSFYFFYSSPNLSGRRLDVYYTSTRDVALVRM